MKSTEDIIWDTIISSAKARLDCKSFDAVFQEIGHDNIAENVLLKIIVGFSSGETKEDIAAQLKTDMLLIGYGFEDKGLESLLANKEEELRSEIHVTKFALSMLEQGTHPGTILNAVRQMLN